jgi:hypothetical protein
METKKVNRMDEILIAYYKAVEIGNKHEAKILLDLYAEKAVREKVRIETEFAVSIFAIVAGFIATMIYI